MNSSGIIYQAKNDGTIEINEQAPKLNDGELQNLFEKILGTGSWEIKFIGEQTGLLIYNISSGSLTMELYVYLFNVRSSSRGRPKEQRIQLNSNISGDGFLYVNSRTKKCLVLGVYYRNNYGSPMICAWRAEKKNNHGKQKSCYVDIETIATAMRDGLATKKDAVGDVVCVFKPEFIHYYIMNMDKLHD